MKAELREIVSALRAEGLRCNCDLDKWEPEPDTGHSFVCRIHKKAKAVYRERQSSTTNRRSTHDPL